MVALLALLVSAALAGTEPRPGDDSFAALIRTADVLSAGGDYAAAERTLQSALAEAKGFAPDDVRLALLHNNLGTVYFGLGRDADSERHYRLGIAVLEKTKPEHESYLIRSICNLARIHILAGEYRKAENLQLDFWVRRLELARSNEPILATLFATLSKLNSRLRRCEQAELQAVRALAIWDSLEPGSVNVADVLNDLGNLYADTNRNAEALACYQRAADLVTSSFGSDHPNLASLLANLGTLHLNSQRPAVAASLLERASAIAENRLGLVHPVVGRILSTYAVALEQTGRRREAKRCQKRARAILQRAFEEDPRRHKIDFSELLRK